MAPSRPRGAAADRETASETASETVSETVSAACLLPEMAVTGAGRRTVRWLAVRRAVTGHPIGPGSRPAGPGRDDRPWFAEGTGPAGAGSSPPA